MRNLRSTLVVLFSTTMLLSVMVGRARAETIQVFERNTNADLSFFTYASLGDTVTGHSASTGFHQAWGVWGLSWSMAGLAHDGAQYIQVFDHNTTAALSFFTYASFGDTVTGYSASTGHYSTAASVWSPDWSMTGLAYDGTQYIQVFDHNTTAALSFFTYASFGDVVTGHSARTGHYATAASVWSPDWSMAGLAYDGTQYVQVFDHNTTGELSFFTYATLGDVVTGHSSRTGHYSTPTGVWNPNWSMVGLAAPIPEPATLLLLGTGLAAAGVRRRMKKRG